jgi:hypothetical protein
LIARSNHTALKANWITKTVAGIQKTKIPFQANGPDLKNCSTMPGVNTIGAQMFR